MELLELFAKAIAPQLLNRIFDNVPQSAILLAVIMFFVIKYLLKWNNNRLGKLAKKEERSNAILEEIKLTREEVKLTNKTTQEISAKVDKLETEHQQDKIAVSKQFKEVVDKSDKKFELINSQINSLDKRILTIEVENQANSKQESAVITMLNRIINSIDKK